MNGRTNTTSVTEVIEGVQVPLEAPTNLVLTPLNARVDITWTDPVDKFAAPDGQTATNPWDNVATWDHSIVVRKANSAPTSPSDGELIYTETTRNQHQYTAYSDTNNVINNTVYYYAVYAITTMDTVSDPIVDSCKPIEGTPEYHSTFGSLYGRYRLNPNPGSIGDYALFAGGPYGNPYMEYTGAVDTVNASLTVGSATSLPSSMGRTASTSRSDCVLFCGGEEARYSNNLSATDAVISYDAALTQATISSLSSNANLAGAATINDISLIAGGARRFVDVYNESLVKSNAPDMPTSLDEVIGDKIGSHVVFGGGIRIISEYDRVSSTQVIAYSQSLTLQSLTGLDVPRNNCACASLDNCIIFAGGEYNGEGSYGEGYHSEVDAYNASLTKLSGVSALPGGNVSGTFASCPASAARCGSYIIINYGTGMDITGFVQYDSSLTQSHVKNSENVSNMSGTRFATLGNYALLPDYGPSTPIVAFKAM